MVNLIHVSFCRNFFVSLWEGDEMNTGDRPVPYKTGEEVEEELGDWRNLYEDVFEEQAGEQQLLEKIEAQFEVS